MPASATLTAQISALIEERTGIARGAYSSVSLDAAVVAAGGGAALLHTLQTSPERAAAWQNLLNTLLIGETYFFRNQAHFNLLRQVIAPQFGERELRVWSAGCSTGEETYSLAIALNETLPDLPVRGLRLIGTDINSAALATAEQGHYREWSFRQTEPGLRERYFTPQAGGWLINPALRGVPRFQQHSLLTGAPLRQLDLIFCCNVLLYFEEQAIRRAESLFFDALAPGGWLVLGPAEALRFERERWQTHIYPGALLYRKPPTGESQPVVLHPPAPLPERPLPTPPLTHSEAVLAAREKRYEDAARILSDILARQPDHVGAHVLMGSVLGNQGVLPEALRHLESALQLDPLLADAHYLKGVLLLETDQRQTGEHALRSALYCQRGHPLAALILGHLHQRNGDAARARRTWQEALDFLAETPDNAFISDLSDLTVNGLRTFLAQQIARLE
jgi:chemotaxis protein methyltransferase CheR